MQGGSGRIADRSVGSEAVTTLPSGLVHAPHHRCVVRYRADGRIDGSPEPDGVHRLLRGDGRACTRNRADYAASRTFAEIGSAT